MNVMPVSKLIEKVAVICRKAGVKRLDLFGSFATGTAAPTSDINFVVYGCEDILGLEDALLEIDTLRKIMESESINRYHIFCKSLKNLSKGLTADPKADFVFGRNSFKF